MRPESLHDHFLLVPDTEGLWDLGDPLRTEKAIRDLLPPLDAGTWTRDQVAALARLIRLHALTFRLDDAEASLTVLRRLVDRLGPEVKAEAQVRLNLEAGRAVCLRMIPVKAREPLWQAWETSSAQPELIDCAIDAAVMISLILPIKEKGPWLDRASHLARSPNPRARAWQPALHLLDGWRHFDTRRFDEALRNFESGIVASVANGEAAAGSAPALQWACARTLRALGRVDEAFKMQQDLREAFLDRGRVDGHVELEIAENLQLLERHDEAKESFRSAHQLLSKNEWYRDNREAELSRILKLSKN